MNSNRSTINITARSFLPRRSLFNPLRFSGVNPGNWDGQITLVIETSKKKLL